MNIKIHHTGSAGNLIQIDNILIDPGVPIKKIKDALHYRLRDIRFCLLSHAHNDHAKGAKDIMKAGVDIYCSQESAEALKLHGHRLHIIEPEKKFQVGSWVIYPFELKHDVMNLGFFIGKGTSKRVLYATDTNYIHPRFN
jgi:phosphoribosyl 1,2-cyclic phosphodiesterase